MDGLISLKKLKIEVWLYKRYVDDANLGLKPPKRGMIYIEGRLTKSLELDPHEPSDKYVAGIITDVANDVLPEIVVMESDVASNHDTG